MWAADMPATSDHATSTDFEDVEPNDTTPLVTTSTSVESDAIQSRQKFIGRPIPSVSSSTNPTLHSPIGTRLWSLQGRVGWGDLDNSGASALLSGDPSRFGGATARCCVWHSYSNAFGDSDVNRCRWLFVDDSCCSRVVTLVEPAPSYFGKWWACSSPVLHVVHATPGTCAQGSGKLAGIAWERGCNKFHQISRDWSCDMR